MATFDYYSRMNGPATRNMIWNEVIHQETRDHFYHNLNTKLEDFQSIEGREVGVKDFYKGTLAWIKNKYYQAAGQPTELVKMSRVNRINPYKQQKGMQGSSASAADLHADGGAPHLYLPPTASASARSTSSSNRGRTAGQQVQILTARSSAVGASARSSARSRASGRSQSVPHIAVPR
ncbi:unnamed protein product [Amoebophrya sp. A25]|nr:unnamed protein product [Amoebophrya sp. A25]|eukprot:GSA25T00015483001.1